MHDQEIRILLLLLFFRLSTTYELFSKSTSLDDPFAMLAWRKTSKEYTYTKTETRKASSQPENMLEEHVSGFLYPNLLAHISPTTKYQASMEAIEMAGT